MRTKRYSGAFTAVLFLLALTGIAWTQQLAPGVHPDLSPYPWIYLRDGEPLKAGEEAVELVAVGDVMLGRGVSGEENIFADTPWLGYADLALGNLECTLAPQDAVVPSSQDTADFRRPYLLIAPHSAAEWLSQAGFDLLGLANNHALDRGLAGLAETGTALETAGIYPLGAAAEPAEAFKPVIRQVKGLKLALLAFNAVPSPRGPEWSGEVRGASSGPGWALAGWNRERAIAAVQSARTQADVVVVSIHWGYEYETQVDPAQQDIARDLVAAGANLVVGHHPHVVQEVEQLSGAEAGDEALVAYSLGNFVFDQGFDETGHGLALRAFFDQQGLRAVQALPVHAGLRPKLQDPSEAAGLLERIAPRTVKQAWRCSGQACTPAAAPPSRRSGRFHIGESDLTGNGTPEKVILEAARAQIENDGQTEWESPPEWQVIDLAPGDPNRDGRQELLLALQKPDSSGILLSHPFILGYRGGEWRVLWGGSAASDPILEVELGDLEGDGLQELAVLEELHNGSGQAISVWRWNGWGFSQVWRSAPSRYTNLRLVRTNEGVEMLLVVDETVIREAD